MGGENEGVGGTGGEEDGGRGLAGREGGGGGGRLPSGEWLSPPLVPGTFLVNIGNVLRRMSNERFMSTPHGVIVDGQSDRYSLAYFHSPNPYATIDVAPSCISADSPARYEPRLYADLIHEFFSANYFHQKEHATIKMENRYD